MHCASIYMEKKMGYMKRNCEKVYTNFRSEITDTSQHILLHQISKFHKPTPLRFMKNVSAGTLVGTPLHKYKGVGNENNQNTKR